MKDKLVSDYLHYLNNSPTPYHATLECVKKLEANNFTRIHKVDIKTIQPGKYYIKQNKTLLFAFTIPQITKNADNRTYHKKPLKIIATHNDSPVLKIKPRGLDNNSNMVNLYCYGGGLWHTWFDRPLGIAGQVIDENMECELVMVKKPLLYIPSLAIHLDKGDVYKNGFQYNKETHLNAIYSTDKNKGIILDSVFNNNAKNILSFDLSLFDIQEAMVGGKNNEYVFSARQDNLLSTFCGIESIIETNRDSASVNVLAIFDHEEIGSKTITGAETEAFRKFLFDLEMVTDIGKSLVVSCDVAHGFNPNYAEKYEKNHAPILGKGIVIKYSPRYATSNFTAAIIKKLMGSTNVQEFILRNDGCGGSTIGPMLVAGTGIKGIDIGAPVLGMHSIKEVSHVNDINDNYKLFKNFYSSDLF